MKSGLVLWEAPKWSKMDWFEFQFLYVSPAPLLVRLLMSSKPAKGGRVVAGGLLRTRPRTAEHQRGPGVSLRGIGTLP